MYVVGILLLVVLGALVLKFGFKIFLALFEFLLRNIVWVLVVIFLLILMPILFQLHYQKKIYQLHLFFSKPSQKYFHNFHYPYKMIFQEK